AGPGHSGWKLQHRMQGFFAVRGTRHDLAIGLRREELGEPIQNDRVADRRIAADVLDRHPADPDFRGAPWLAAVVRPWRDGGVWLVDDGLPHQKRIESAHPGLDHSVSVSVDAYHAAHSRRNARSAAAHRLREVRARPRTHRPRN